MKLPVGTLNWVCQREVSWWENGVVVCSRFGTMAWVSFCCCWWWWCYTSPDFCLVLYFDVLREDLQLLLFSFHLPAFETRRHYSLTDLTQLGRLCLWRYKRAVPALGRLETGGAVQRQPELHDSSLFPSLLITEAITVRSYSNIFIQQCVCVVFYVCGVNMYMEVIVHVEAGDGVGSFTSRALQCYVFEISCH